MSDWGFILQRETREAAEWGSEVKGRLFDELGDVVLWASGCASAARLAAHHGRIALALQEAHLAGRATAAALPEAEFWRCESCGAPTGIGCFLCDDCAHGTDPDAYR